MVNELTEVRRTVIHYIGDQYNWQSMFSKQFQLEEQIICNDQIINTYTHTTKLTALITIQ